MDETGRDLQSVKVRTQPDKLASDSENALRHYDTINPHAWADRWWMRLATRARQVIAFNLGRIESRKEESWLM